MKPHPIPQATARATLQTVLDRLAVDPSLSATRKRDLRSAVTSFAKLTDQPPAAIPLDLADIRRALDGIVPARAKISSKRWANLRSDLAGAIQTSGLRPMLKTADVHLDEVWSRLLASADQRIRHGLSRFAAWASLRGIRPEAVNGSAMERFIAELEGATLVRNLRYLPRRVAKQWNALVSLHEAAGLRPVVVPTRRAPKRIPWERLPASLAEDVEGYITWASVPDPLAEKARARALAPGTLQLQRAHIHSAVSAAAAAGIPLALLTSLARLTEPETFRALLRHRWREDGCKLSAYTHGLAVTLIAIASEWVQAPANAVAALKALRSKLGALPSGLTEKNIALLRRFDDPRLIVDLIQLPDRIWHAARRRPGTSRRAFVDLQTALAIDVLLHVPLRMQNLTALTFDVHVHRPQGRRKPALVTFRGDEIKNGVQLDVEIPTALADRLYMFRNEIAPAVIGERPDAVFVSWTGKRRTQAAIRIAIEKTVLKYLGVRLTPHQFRHLAAKFVLDNYPGAYELVRQLLTHTNLRTTTSFYCGLDTRRAGRAHAALLMKLRESKVGSRPGRRTSRPRGD